MPCLRTLSINSCSFLAPALELPLPKSATKSAGSTNSPSLSLASCPLSILARTLSACPSVVPLKYLPCERFAIPPLANGRSGSEVNVSSDSGVRSEPYHKSLCIWPRHTYWDLYRDLFLLVQRLEVVQRLYLGLVPLLVPVPVLQS